MFENIPRITDENLNVMLERELARFKSIITRCQQDEYTLDQVVDTGCEEFGTSNPNLLKAVRACAFGVFGGLEDDYGPEVAWKAGVLTIPGLLVALRLIDRELEAQEIERRLG